MDRQHIGFRKGFMVLAAFLFFMSGSHVGLALEYEFIGAKKCSICHKSPEQGEQFRIWQESKHAHAFELLKTPQAKETAAKLGVDSPETSGRCLKCHSTAYGFSESKISEMIPVEEGVSCESCHGPGKDYMKKSVMEDREQAIAAGLIIPNEQTCVKCHNSESPTFQPFNYQERYEKIKHPLPE